MLTLLAPTEDFIIVERTKLNADVSAGSDVTLTLESNGGFAENDFVVIGQGGAEKAELEQINAAVAGGTDIQVATLLYAHKKGEPVVKFRYNKRKFYGATTKTGTYTELTSDGSPVTIQVDDPQGTYLEYTGGEGYTFFKATYYNSQDLTETAIGDSDAVEADESKRYCSIYDIRKQCGLVENPYITDGRIERKRKQAEGEINSAIFSRYTLPLSEIPDVIKVICQLLAAGYIDYEEYGSEGQGVKWLGEARGMLKQIKDGRMVLLDSDYEQLQTQANGSSISGIPNSSTEDTAGEDVKFKISDEY